MLLHQTERLTRGSQIGRRREAFTVARRDSVWVEGGEVRQPREAAFARAICSSDHRKNGHQRSAAGKSLILW